MFKKNGTPLCRKPSRTATLLALGLSLTLLTGCGTISTATNKQAQCAAWRAISYSAKKDTAETVKQVRVHDATGKRLGCW